MNVMGIDPGKDGGIAVLADDAIQCWPMSAILNGSETMLSLTSAFSIRHVFIEKAQSMPKNGGAHMFSYGVGFGKILGWLEAINVPYTLIPPATWAKKMHLGCTGKSTKEKSVQAAMRLFPGNSWILPGCRKPHDGIAEAALIAEFGKRSIR